MKKVNRNTVLLLLAVIAITVYIICNVRKPEDYEADTDDPELPKITQAELDAVMKFIRKTD